MSLRFSASDARPNYFNVSRVGHARLLTAEKCYHAVGRVFHLSGVGAPHRELDHFLAPKKVITLIIG